MTWKPDMDNVEKHAWRYSGDVNLEEGGLFWYPLCDDMVAAVEVQPLPENPGADYEDEAWNISWDGHIFMNLDTLAEVVSQSGYQVTKNGMTDSDGTILTDEQAFAAMVDSYNGYSGMEDHQTFTVSRSELTAAGMTLIEYAKEYAEMGPDVPATAPEPEELPTL